MEQVAQGFDLLEGPVWDPQRGLLFADADGGGVYLLRDGTVSTIVPHRRGIGGMALHAEGGLVVGGRNLAYKGPAGEDTLVLVDNDVTTSAQVGFSDIVSSPKGQVYAGTLGSRPDPQGHVARGGGLYLIDLDGSCRAVIAAQPAEHDEEGKAREPLRAVVRTLCIFVCYKWGVAERLHVLLRRSQIRGFRS